MVTVRERDGHYVVTFPVEITHGLSIDTYNRLRKLSHAQCNAYMCAVYAAAVYEKHDTDDVEMDFREEVMPIIKRVLELSEEDAERIADAVEREVLA